MWRQTNNILSAVFFGVFLAPVFSIIWFVVPWLRNFPVGDDSPHGVGLPLGLSTGMVLAWWLNRKFNWGRPATLIGGILLAGSLLCAFATFRQMQATAGWEGFRWLALLLLSLHAAVSALGLLLSGVFSTLGNRAPADATSPPQHPRHLPRQESAR